MDITAYTPKSVSILKNTIAHAEKILNTTSASQSTVNKELKVLQNAKNQLVFIADFSKLATPVSYTHLDVYKRQHQFSLYQFLKYF